MNDVIKLSLGFPFASLVLNPIVAPIPKVRLGFASDRVHNVRDGLPQHLCNYFTEATAAHIMEPLGQIITREATERVPPHVETMLHGNAGAQEHSKNAFTLCNVAETVPQNVTNILQDSLTILISRVSDHARQAARYVTARGLRACTPLWLRKSSRSLSRALRTLLARDCSHVCIGVETRVSLLLSFV